VAPLTQYVQLALVLLCAVLAAISYVKFCRRLQGRYPVKWTEFDFPRGWIAPSVDEEGQQIRAQFRLLGFILRGEYRELKDGWLETWALLFKTFGCGVVLLLVLSIWYLACFRWCDL
jgi:hypothetical protein